MRNRAEWVHVLAYGLLALAVAAAALAFASVRVLGDAHIPGSAPGYRYYTLGVQRSSGPSFALDSTLLAQLGPLLPADVRAAMAIGQKTQLRRVAGASPVLDTQAELVSGDYLHALHVPVVAGRLLQPQDVADCHAVVVLATAVATRLFGSPAQAIGNSVQVRGQGSASGVSLRVIGVVPDAFRGLSAQQPAQAWVPLLFLPQIYGQHFQTCTAEHPHAGVAAFSISGLAGVLSAPASMPQAQLAALLHVAWQRLPATARGKDESGLVVSAPYSSSPQALTRQMHRSALYLALALAALALATINVFTLRWLALVRRRSVLQLERVLGATRAYLQRRYLRRTAVLALVLLLAAALLAVGGALALRHLLGAHAAELGRLSLPALASTLAWALPLLLLVVVVAEALPLLVLLRRERIDAGARLTLSRSDRNIGLLVLTLEVLLAAVVSCAAAWSVRYAWQQRHAELGLLRTPVTLVALQRKPADEQGMVFLHPSQEHGTPVQVLLLDALTRAVRAVAPDARVAIGPLPSARATRNPVSVMAGTRTTSATPVLATPDWFAVAGVKLLAGRGFDPRQATPDAVLMDAASARALFGGVRAAVGASIHYNGAAGRVIGVIAPLSLAGPDHDAVPVVVADFRSVVSAFATVGDTLLIRPAVAADHQAALRQALDAVLQRRAPILHVASIGDSPQLLDRLTRTQTRQAQIFVLIALFAWAITLSGVATHLRLFLAMRKRADAICSALGAGPRRQYTRVLLGTLALAVAAVVLALLFTPWLAQQFALLSGAQVAPYGWPTWIALLVLLAAVFLVAHFPARRAAHAEPAQSLHEL